MHRFKKILVVIDPETSNSSLLNRAVTLGQRNNASLTITMVIENLPDSLPGADIRDQAQIPGSDINIIEELSNDFGAAGFPQQIEIPSSEINSLESTLINKEMPNEWESPVEFLEQILEAENDYLDQIVVELRQEGIAVNRKVMYGTPDDQIIREVLRNGYDLVMMTGEGKTGLKEMLFGSTSMHLMRKCPCPVWVMNPMQPEHYSHIMAAVDPIQNNPERSNLNIKILDLATSLALRDQSELIILHAWKHYLEKYVQSGRVKVSKTTYDQWIEDLRNERRRSLNALLEGYNFQDIKYKVYLLRGDADKLIPDLAKTMGIELIVMGTVCRTGLAGFLIGNTAERILRKVDCSVLTIKPDGFISPVMLDS